MKCYLMGKCKACESFVMIELTVENLNNIEKSINKEGIGSIQRMDRFFHVCENKNFKQYGIINIISITQTQTQTKE